MLKLQNYEEKQRENWKWFEILKKQSNKNKSKIKKQEKEIRGNFLVKKVACQLHLYNDCKDSSNFEKSVTSISEIIKYFLFFYQSSSSESSSSENKDKCL